MTAESSVSLGVEPDADVDEGAVELFTGEACVEADVRRLLPGADDEACGGLMSSAKLKPANDSKDGVVGDKMLGSGSRYVPWVGTPDKLAKGCDEPVSELPEGKVMG